MCEHLSMMPPAPHVKMETLTRFLFAAPPWRWSLLLIVAFGLAIDGLALLFAAPFPFPGTLLFTAPALFAFVLTKPVVDISGGILTWNRSGLLALVCWFLTLVGTLGTFILHDVAIFPFLYSYSLGFILALRLLVLTAVADYRISHTLIPASLQSIGGIVAGTYLFSSPFFIAALISNVALAVGGIFLIFLIELPFYRAFHIHGLRFLNLFLAHLTDGSRELEDYFRKIGEEATVPQTTLAFRRGEKQPVLVTVPNFHPGPMGDVGGTNLPTILSRSLPGEVLVCHGCATHDYNPVAESEIEKIAHAVNISLSSLQYAAAATPSIRETYESVSVICQAFGDAVLVVVTRSPQKTEDVDPALGQIIMAEGEKDFAHVAFVDAHNCMTEVTTPVHPSTPLAQEYIRAAKQGMDRTASLPPRPFRVGVSRVAVPFGRSEGFGALGVQALVVEVEWQKTAYVLLDGNNIIHGAREVLLASLEDIVDQCEVMTTDSHVVNTITGLNPIGYRVPPQTIAPYIRQAVEEAIRDLSEAEAAGATALCERVMIFGIERISQLASTVNAIIIFLLPLSLTILLLAFFLSVVAYLIML
jgi:putative membrane protein